MALPTSRGPVKAKDVFVHFKNICEKRVRQYQSKNSMLKDFSSDVKVGRKRRTRVHNLQTTNFSRNPLMSAKSEQQDSKGNRRSQKGAKIAAIGQAIRKRRMSPVLISISHKRMEENAK